MAKNALCVHFDDCNFHRFWHAYADYALYVLVYVHSIVHGGKMDGMGTTTAWDVEEDKTNVCFVVNNRQRHFIVGVHFFPDSHTAFKLCTWTVAIFSAIWGLCYSWQKMPYVFILLLAPLYRSIIGEHGMILWWCSFFVHLIVCIIPYTIGIGISWGWRRIKYWYMQLRNTNVC